MQIIKSYVEQKKSELAEKVSQLAKKPKLVILQVGNVEASNRYVKGKLSDCESIGLPCELIHLEEDITENALIKKIKALNKDEEVTGFIVQLPLPKHIDELKIINTINPKKDVDGFTLQSLVNPATPQGILNYLEDNNFKFENANAVVIGRSNIVGKPMARLLLDKNCNVTILHSKTSPQNRLRALTGADLVIVATGTRNTITDYDASVTNPNCIIVDVGININEQDKLCGDCETVTLREKTPVPGGCGLLTRLTLLTNTLKIFNKIEK